MRVEALTADRTPDWDAFVTAMPEATFFHRSAWRTVIERAFGHRTHYCFVEAEGRVEGILPLAEIRSPLFGHALASTPFCVYGGAVAKSEAARRALEQYAVELGRTLNVDHVEFRNRLPSGSGRPGKALYVTFRKALDPDPERNLNAVPRKQRAMIRKGSAAGLRATLDPGPARLHRVYAESVRNLGTPVFSRRYFEVLQEVFADDCEVLTVEAAGRPVASVMNFYFRDEVLPYYGGGTAAARDLKANDFMYWEVMRRAVERGVRWFDFGRSKLGTGSYRFKTHWGFEPEPLAYEYELIRARQIPDLNPLNPKYRLFIAAWRRLPLPLSRWLGPWLSRDLG